MKKIFISTTILILVLVISGVILLYYQPPILDRGDRNIPEGFIDHLAFAWYFTKATWFEGGDGREESLVNFARTVWYRPILSERIFNVERDDYLGLAHQFESLGLDREAALLFSAAYNQGGNEATSVRQMILGCAGLGAWDEVLRISRDVESLNPGFKWKYYWWGRALIELDRAPEAVNILRIAVARDPGIADTHFQMGRAFQSMGKAAPAEREYLRAVEISPRHGAAWKALAGIYTEAGQGEESSRAAQAAAVISPPISAHARFGSDMILLGYEPTPDRIEGEEKFSFDLYHQILPGPSRTITPRVRIKSGRFQRLITLDTVTLPETSPGENRVARVEGEVPWNISPLSSQLLIGFLDETGQPLRLSGSRDQEYMIGSVDVAPRLFSTVSDYPRLKEVIGEGAFDLRKRTVLAEGSEVEIEIEEANRSGAVGFISYAEGCIAQPLGREIARIECRAADGEIFDFSIRLGVETADRWLESRAPGVARHLPVRTFSSLRIEAEKSPYSIYTYQGVLQFPEVIDLSLLKLKYAGPPEGNWVIEAIFLMDDS